MDGNSDKKPKCCNQKIDCLAIFSLFLNIALICYVVYGSVSQQKTNASLRQDIDALKQVSLAHSTGMYRKNKQSVKVCVRLYM